MARNDVSDGRREHHGEELQRYEEKTSKVKIKVTDLYNRSCIHSTKRQIAQNIIRMGQKCHDNCTEFLSEQSKLTKTTLVNINKTDDFKVWANLSIDSICLSTQVSLSSANTIS